MVLPSVGVADIPPVRPCSPSVVLSGDTRLVERIASHPSLDTLAKEAVPGCPAVWVTVGKKDNQIEVSITDHMGRQSNQRVTHLDTACAIIDSWARGDALIASDMSEPVQNMAASTPPSNPAAVVAPDSLEDSGEPSTDSQSKNLKSENASCPSEVKKDSAATPTREKIRALDITAGFALEYSIGADVSSWFGGNTYICAAPGLFCLGVLFRGGFDPGVSGDYRKLNSIRSGMDTMLLIGLPFKVQRVRLMPAIEFGAGWSQSSSRVVIGGNEKWGERSFGGMRLGFSCLVSVHLIRGLHFDTRVSFASLFIVDEGPVVVEDIEIAGEARNYFRLSTGLSWRWW
ncbi:MAG: hypothetical protein JXR76_10845 [Deltaproteobacteria bacterium]|nr:hypothetical protein [Deltaproteobacteria bacterium]